VRRKRRSVRVPCRSSLWAARVTDWLFDTRPVIETCKRCGYMSSNDLCKACSLLEGLERGMSTAAIVRHAVALVPLSYINLIPIE